MDIEEEEFIKKLRKNDTPEEKMDFEVNTKTIIIKNDNEDDGYAPILVDEKAGALKGIFIEKTPNIEKNKYKCKLVVNHLVEHGVKLSDLEIIDLGDRAMIRRKKKTE
ncbi:MAG: hypothetical protein ACR5K5_00950 [Wolbachia sp.]